MVQQLCAITKGKTTTAPWGSLSWEASSNQNSVWAPLARSNCACTKQTQVWTKNHYHYHANILFFPVSKACVSEISRRGFVMLAVPINKMKHRGANNMKINWSLREPKTRRPLAFSWSSGWRRHKAGPAVSAGARANRHCTVAISQMSWVTNQPFMALLHIIILKRLPATRWRS